MFFCVTVKDEKGNIDTDMNSIGNINPFRYRGYYYDTETGFYYLQTRYYDPTTCRFINADNYELISTLSQVPGQLNLYAYANNNPIMNTDETGEGVLTFIVFLVAFTIVGAGVGLGVGVSAGHTDWELVVDFSLGAGVGLMSGGLFASVGGVLGIVFHWSSVLGISAIQAFALGTAIYDLIGFIIAGIANITFQPIEFSPNENDNSPKGEPPAIIRPYNYYIPGGDLW